MKKILIPFIVLFCFSISYADFSQIIQCYNAAGGASCSGDICEGFEGTGYEQFSVNEDDDSILDPDYTGVAIKGSQVLRFNKSDASYGAWISYDFGSGVTTRYYRGYFYIDSVTPNATYSTMNECFIFGGSNGHIGDDASAWMEIQERAAGNYCILMDGADNSDRIENLSLDQIYRVEIKIVDGGGVDTSEMRLYEGDSTSQVSGSPVTFQANDATGDLRYVRLAVGDGDGWVIDLLWDNIESSTSDWLGPAEW